MQAWSDSLWLWWRRFWCWANDANTHTRCCCCESRKTSMFLSIVQFHSRYRRGLNKIAPYCDEHVYWVVPYCDVHSVKLLLILCTGSAKSAKSQRRVARLDKIMDDMFRHKKLNTDGKSGQGDRILQEVTVHSKAAVRASHKASPRQSSKPSSSAFTPRGSPRPYSGSPRPHAGSPRPHTGSPKPSTAAATFTPRGSPRPSSGSPKLSSAPSDTSQPRDSPKSKLSPKRLTWCYNFRFYSF